MPGAWTRSAHDQSGRGRCVAHGKTICLAVSPSLKAVGISGRARLFEVIQRVKQVNRERLQKAPGHVFTGKSTDAEELADNPSLELDYIAAVPRMSYYMEYSTRIYRIYLKYISPQDIHVYSIDEVFIDATDYLHIYGMTARELAVTMIRDVLKETGITATAGIGTNLYLAKIAMDIVAKHVDADEDGVRIAELDEMSYRRQLWNHRPLTDFWRVGRGYAKKLEEHGLFTMGDIARCSLGKDTDLHNEELLYRLFGINAELLIRRITLALNHVVREEDVKEPVYEQMDLFTDYAALEKEKEEKKQVRKKERSLQETMLSIRKRYGNDAVLRGLNLKEGATGRERGKQIGGHRA